MSRCGAVAEGVGLSGHGGVGGGVGEEIGGVGEDLRLIGADQDGAACIDGLGTLGGITEDKEGL